MAPLAPSATLDPVAADFRRPNGSRPMRALAYLLGARALDAASESDRGVHRPKQEPAAGPLATTDATAAAWRRWRDDAQSAAPARPASTPATTPLAVSRAFRHIRAG